MSAPTKRCRKCSVDKPLNDFTPDRKKVGGREHACRVCRRSARQAAGGAEARRAAHLRRAYGLTPEGRSALVERQAGSCPICLRPLASVKRSHVDHCHRTGQVRGVLCSECNTGIGKLNDCPATLTRALAYLTP